MPTSLQAKFPANREINRENRKIRPEVATRSSRSAASKRVFSDIPCKKLTGKDFGITGKLRRNNREIKGTTAGYGLDQWRWELHQRPRRLISLRMISRMIAPIVALMMAVMMPEPR